MVQTKEASLVYDTPEAEPIRSVVDDNLRRPTVVVQDVSVNTSINTATPVV